MKEILPDEEINNIINSMPPAEKLAHYAHGAIICMSAAMLVVDSFVASRVLFDELIPILKFCRADIACTILMTRLSLSNEEDIALSLFPIMIAAIIWMIKDENAVFDKYRQKYEEDKKRKSTLPQLKRHGKR